MDAAIREKIESTVTSTPVVLYMKGNRSAPQCGFSAQVVQILDELLDDYLTVDVLADPEIRDGVKAYADWPTIPQLYIKGEFVGGCDIVKEMFGSGQLEDALGIQAAEIAPPQLTISPSAAEALSQALQSGEEKVRLEIDKLYRHGLSIGPASAKDVVATSQGLAIHMDRASAKRAEGLSIDFVDSPQGKAFKLDNPNEPAKVRSISVVELKKRLSEGALHLFDPRSQKERDTASIEGSTLLDRAAQDALLKLPRNEPIYFHCHHGGRSRQAAEFFIAQGFKEVYNVEGGIDAWSLEIDPNVPRY